MKLFADWLPIILFFIVYKLTDLYLATGVAIAATLVIMAWMKFQGHAIETMHWVSLVLIVVFGGATIILQDETFIKLKPTLLYALFAGALLVPQFTTKLLLIQKMMQSKIQMPQHAWEKLNAAWGIFFAAMAVLNFWVAETFSTDAWVNFKLFGSIGLMIVFIIGQALWLNKFAVAELPDVLKDKNQP
jgi:intracellular septation protein